MEAQSRRARRLRDAPMPTATIDEIEGFLRGAVDRYGHLWRKSAREPGAEAELAKIAVANLHRLQLVSLTNREVRPLPAIIRFALGEPELRTQPNRR